jgi:hypothetical protein
MSLALWIVFYLLSCLLWSWILFWGGDEWLEGSFLSGLFVHVLAPRWSADGLRIFAGGTWFVQTIWFVVGLIFPEARW